MSLLARAYNEAVGYSPRVWPFFASVLGPQIIPLYEDRPMMESLKSHVRVTGARLADSPQEADLLLAINCPGKVMQESFVPESEKDLSYTSYRQLFDFTHRIAEYLAEGRRVALCDSAFANGGDVQCIRYLDRLGRAARSLRVCRMEYELQHIGHCACPGAGGEPIRTKSFETPAIALSKTCIIRPSFVRAWLPRNCQAWFGLLRLRGSRGTCRRYHSGRPAGAFR